MLWIPLKQVSSKCSISLPPVAFNGYLDPYSSNLDLYNYNSGASTTFLIANHSNVNWYSNVDSLSKKLNLEFLKQT